MGIYSLWPVLTTLGLDSPISAEAWPTTTCWIVDGVSRSADNDFAYPLSSKARFEFAAKGDMPAVELYWYDGGMAAGDARRHQGGEDSRGARGDDSLHRR